ncbi:MAG: ferrous iron transporter B, partial [Thiobacillus sp.]
NALLAELGVPTAMALNMHDEASARGVTVDASALSEALGIPVVPTVATGGEGVSQLTRHLSDARTTQALLHYDSTTEDAIGELAQLIMQHRPHPRLAARGLAILYLGEDSEVEAWLRNAPHDAYAEMNRVRTVAHSRGVTPPALAHERGEAAGTLATRVTRRSADASPLLSHRVGQWVIHRVWAWPILLGVLFAVYLFVGVFGAGTLVGVLEDGLFGEVLNPAIGRFVETRIDTPWLADLLVGQYGLWTMGMTYALALILPIVTTFFIAFGLLEDSGYFARLSVLANRLFKLFGLNGRAVLPMVLGLGCVTMATLTTRILHSPRERLIAIFLMALAIPCSAQLGVVLGFLGAISFGATLIWLAVMVAVLVLAGLLAARLIPGRRIPLVTEMPPMRLPVPGNVAKKTIGRLKWYLIEVIPLFLIGTLIMFLLDQFGALSAVIRAGEPLVSGWLGLPPEASAAFVMGFLRRDFGATGLFALSAELSATQAVVGMVTLTLFVPCIASVLMIVKEQGVKIAGAMLALIVPFAFFVGGLLNHALRALAGIAG